MAPTVTALFGDEAVARLVQEVAPSARAFARVLPSAVLVPALAVRGTPVQVRIVVAIALAMPIAVAFPWVRGVDAPLGAVLFVDAVRGLPLAVLLATPLWIAAHVGAIADVLRGAPPPAQAAPPVDGARSPLAMLTALLASAAWISGGGTTRALHLLSAFSPLPGPYSPPSSTSGGGAGGSPGGSVFAGAALAARALTDGLRLGVALSAGVLVAMIAFEALLATIGRVATPLSPQPIAVLARPLVALVALAFSIEVAVLALVR